MSDMDYLERQALERLSFVNKNTFKGNENVSRNKKGEKIRQKVTSMPVEYPTGYSYPNFKAAFSEEEKKQAESTGKIEQKEHQSSNSLNELLRDPESALLTGLMMLLRQEGADEALLAALGYILL